jgi:plastocyanin
MEAHMLRLATLAAAGILFATACGSSSAPAASGGQLTATLTDSAIQLSQAAVANGPVTITVKNTGSVNHTLEVLKTNLAADKIPFDQADQSKADERGKVSGTTSELKPGQSVDLKLDLTAGKYVVICNLPAHYQIGMHAPLTVN